MRGALADQVAISTSCCSIKPHEFFERDGNDLHCVIPISLPQAALGDELMIPTLDGETRLKIPEGTQSGKEFRIRGKGVPYLNEHGRGDLIVADRCADAEEAHQSRSESCCASSERRSTVENTPTSRSLFSKVKEMFS